MDTYFSLKFNFSEKCAGSHLFGVSFCERRDRLVIGEFKSTLDAKGRMNIPLKLREEMGNDLVLANRYSLHKGVFKRGLAEAGCQNK